MMNITLLQTDIHWRNLSANCEEAVRLMTETPDSDLYVLPEMWASGFEMQPDEALAEESRLALAWMYEQAVLRQCAVAGSLPWRIEGVGEQAGRGEVHVLLHSANPLANRAAASLTAKGGGKEWRNRFFFVMPDGRYVAYDKCNLFAYGGETAVYTAGTSPAEVLWRGVRFRLQVCFDLRFPESARNQVSAPYDVLLYVANWPTSRRVAWDALLRARAIENQCYVVGVNRTGSETALSYNGGSAVVDAYGRVWKQLGELPQAYSFSPDLEELKRFRKKFPVLR